ncbi:MAG: GGDEF domain-containing protein [Acidimicrobiia bacterium]|nr:GGDEF domain-containing protein [Acidimicrobiia bacterium]
MTYSVVVGALLGVSWTTSANLTWILQGVVGLLSALAALFAARRNARVGANPWICIATGIALWSSGAMLRDVAALQGATSGHWGDLLTLAGYTAFGTGMLVVGNLRTDASSRTAFLDASVFGIAVALVMWAVLINPFETVQTSTIDRLTLSAYPLGDAILVTVLAWMVLAPGRRSRSLNLVGVGVAVLLGTDLASAAAERLGHTGSAESDIGIALACAVIGAAGLTSTRELFVAIPDSDRLAEPRARLALLAFALLVGPVVTIMSDTSTGVSAGFVGICTAALALGVMARFVSLTHEIRRAHDATTTSERRFRLMADSAPVGIFEVGRGRRVTYANSEGIELLGRAVLGGSTADMFTPIHDESRPALENAISAIELGQSGDAELKLLGEPTRWISWNGVPVMTNEPHLPAAFVSILDITSLKEAEAALGRQATHDPLTGLPNRRLLLESLITALKALGRGHRTGTVALMFIDLDQFKMVNDVLGHDAGDALLKTASARLRNAVRSHDIVARFGGDEFVVLLQHVSDRGELHDVAQRILKALEVPIHVAGTEAKVGASVGIATATGPDDDPDALVRNADAAMYRAKEHGRGRYEFFRPTPSDQAHRTL